MTETQGCGPKVSVLGLPREKYPTLHSPIEDCGPITLKEALID